MITTAEHSDDARSADNQVNFNSRHTGFALNQSKQVKNLKKNADIINYDTVINNFNENINIQCSSGFYLNVASPALLYLAKQTCGSSQLVITGIRIQCSNSRISLDDHNLHVNSTYFFELLDDNTGSVCGKVTVHCHVTAKLVQLQGSRLILGSKAPLWFFEQVLKNTFDREGSERRDVITKTNEDIIQLSSATDLTCTLCDKNYKTASGLQKHVQTKHDSISKSSEPVLPVESRILRKRRGPEISEPDWPPPKTMALGCSSPPTSSEAVLPLVEPSASSTTTVTPSAISSSASILFNLNAEPFLPNPPPQTDFPHFNIQMPNNHNISLNSPIPSLLTSTVTVSSSSARPVSAPSVGIPSVSTPSIPAVNMPSGSTLLFQLYKQRGRSLVS